MKPFDPQLLKVAAPARGYVILTTVFGVATAGLVIAQALLIAAVLAPVISQGKTLTDVRTPLIWLGVVVLMRALIAGLSERYAHRAAIKVIVELRRKVIERAVALGPRWLSAPTTTGSNGLDVVTLATRGLDDLKPYFVRYLPQLLLTATVTPAALAVIFGLDIISAIIIIVTIPLVPIFMILVGQLTQKTSERRLAAMSRLGAQVLDLITGLPTLRAFGREIGPVKRVKELGDAYTNSTMRTLRVAFLSGMILELLTTLSVALVAVGIGMRLVYGHSELQIALAVIMLAPEVYLPIRNVGTHFHASTNGIAAFNAALGVLSHTPKTTGTTTAPDLTSTTITFESVSVRAPERDLLAPAQLNATIHPGHITALVGHSGSGKTTTVLTMLGLVELDAGRITLTHDTTTHALTDIDPTTLWPQVAWLTQRAALPPGTLRNALTEDTRTQASDNELLAAAQQSGFDEVINELPNGLDTLVGVGGIGLSVGQRQRLTLTKALLAQAPVVILDEPTAHLDAATEQRVLTTLTQLKNNGHTVIVIAHRASLIALADHVITVHNSTEVTHAND
ncbi:thiol reductant ABC exporter subunit CydD [Timonella sp. A28]|uniref:thiol reductant ABC exporter subunit CydD n=1 Tax=Timonella sp. A28 TaxID=3442640 RepID=UPI003EB8CA88